MGIQEILDKNETISYTGEDYREDAAGRKHMVPKSIIDFLSSAELIRIKGTEYILTEKGKSIKS